MKDKITIYPAAALFNARELYFNSKLVELLEDKGYKTLLPQRDGLEFCSFEKMFKGKINDSELGQAIMDLIYLVDTGLFIPKSDVVLANFDEPIDEGVVVEAQHASYLNKSVIGFRTEARSPYGDIKNPLRGMHWFPAYQCDQFLFKTFTCTTPKIREKEMQDFVEGIDKVIKDSKPKKTNVLYVHEKTTKVLRASDFLFDGIKNIHSEKCLEEVASRYIKNKKKLYGICPKIIQLK